MKIHYRLFIGILLGIIISVTGTVLAETLVKSEDVPYFNNDSGGTYSDVQDAIDELYYRAQYVGKLYQEDILNGAYPVLGDEMIPIYLSDNGDVYYADLYTKWYSYKEKKWANAVILVDNAQNKYKTGDKIKEEDIESYFVWIPRYAYKIWNLGKYAEAIEGSTLNDSDYAHSTSQASNNARIIDVIFGSVEQLKAGEDIKALTWNPSNGTFSEPGDIAVDNYLIHPGFTLGPVELNGIWVGKFETGYNQTNNGESAITETDKWNTSGAEVDDNNSVKIIVKPEVYSWRSINTSNMFNSAYNYKIDLNSHMMKNTEWGAVAYLSHSSYGKGAEININNNSEYKTGYSLYQPWNSSAGYLASTTGNITGVYDMNGGSWETMATSVIEASRPDNSGFQLQDITNYAKSGYIDAYSISNPCYSRRIMGDATDEMGPFFRYKVNGNTAYNHNSWYSDYSVCLSESIMWVARGGYFPNGAISGEFSFSSDPGGISDHLSFRMALTGTPRAS